MLFQQQIKNALSTLNEGKTILYPTDTVWGIGCDASNFDAVNKVYAIKNRVESKSMIVLVDSLEMLQNIISAIPKHILEIVKNTTKPTSFIFQNPKNLAKNVIAKDNTVAIRIANDVFCKALIHQFGKPIVSTSANISGEPTPKEFAEISSKIKDSVDHIVLTNTQKKNNKSSRILKITEDNKLLIIRE